MKHISCIIFDLDGTLTQTNELIFATFNHVTGKYLSKTYTPDEITGMFGPPEEIAIERLIGKERIDEAMDDFYSFYENHHPRMANAYDGTREMLHYVKRQGLLMAIFTGKGIKSTLITLEKIGIKDLFDLIVTGSDVENHKPSADGIRMVLARFGIEPGQALMVGDAVADVKAAREAGVKIAAVLWDSYGKEKVMEMDVDYRFHHVSQFTEWLQYSLSGRGEHATGR